MDVDGKGALESHLPQNFSLDFDFRAVEDSSLVFFLTITGMENYVYLRCSYEVFQRPQQILQNFTMGINFYASASFFISHSVNNNRNADNFHLPKLLKF